MTKQEFMSLVIGDKITHTASEGLSALKRDYIVTKVYPIDGYSHITVRNVEFGTEYAIMRLQSSQYHKSN